MKRVWIVPQRRQFLVLFYLLIQNMCNSKLQSSNIVGDLIIVTAIGLGAPTCNIVGDLVIVTVILEHPLVIFQVILTL